MTDYGAGGCIPTKMEGGGGESGTRTEPGPQKLDSASMAIVTRSAFTSVIRRADWPFTLDSR